MARGSGRLALWLLGAAYTVLGAVAAWRGVVELASAAAGPTAGFVVGSLAAVVALASVLAGAPGAAWLFSALGVASATVEPVLPLALLAAGSVLLQLSVLAGRRVHGAPGRAAAESLVSTGAVLAAALLLAAGLRGLLLGAAALGERLPGLYREIWVLLASTAAGRLALAATVLIVVYRAVGALESLLTLLMESPGSLARGALRGVVMGHAAALRGGSWYHLLLARLLYMATLPFEAALAALTWLAAGAALERLAGPEPGPEARAAWLAAAAAVAWLGAAALRHLGESLLLRGTGWRRAFLGGLATLAAAAAAIALLGGWGALASLAAGGPGPLDKLGLEEALRGYLEGLEDTLRALTRIVWG